MKKTRIQWIDFAKGIAILLVIIGHTVKNESIVFAIYTFHMPLFFAVSVMTYRLSASIHDYLGNIKNRFGILSFLVLAYGSYMILCFYSLINPVWTV